MTKKQLLFLAIAAVAVPALAVVGISHNSLRKGGPVMKEYQRGPEKRDPKAAEAAKADSILVENRSEELKSRPMKAAPEGVQLPRIAASVYDYATGTAGMYLLPEVSGGEMTLLTDKVSSYYGGALSGNLYYACHDGRFDDYYNISDPHGHKIQAYDIRTWEPAGNEITPRYYRSSDLAINPVDGYGYAYCDLSGIDYRLFKINLQTGEQTDINPSTKFYSLYPNAIAFNDQGVLYSVSSFGDFGIVDMTTGKQSEISRVETPNFRSAQYGNWSMTYDSATGKFLFMYNGSTDYGKTYKSQLFSIDPATGASTLLADFSGKSITSLFVMPDIVAIDAPGAVSGISSDFDNGLLSGTITFTMPSELNNGTAADGAATWNIYEGTDRIATGSAQYGASVSAPVEVAEKGRHYFSISAANDNGEGEKTRYSCWIGPDIPLAPAGVSAIYDEAKGSFDITWTPVTEGVNDGYIDPSGVTYQVKRMPASTIVAQKLTSASFTDTYSPRGVENIYYEVVACHDNSYSDPGKSNTISVGYLELPFELAEVNYNYDLQDWTIIDANQDDNTWEISSYNGVYYRYSYTETADDWFISPPIKSLKGCKYNIVAVLSNRNSYTERAEIKIGSSNDPAGMTTVLLKPTDIDSENMSFSFEYTPETDGRFFIGVHALSEPDKYNLTLNNLKISAPVNDASPLAPVIESVTADPTGALSATGKVTVPSVAENGSTLTSISKLEIMRGVDLVAAIQNPVPGSTVEFTDGNVPEAGVYTYRAYAYNGDNMSAPSENVKMFVGVAIPGKVENIMIRRSDDDPSKGVLTWERPSVDENGYPLNGDVLYSVALYRDNDYSVVTKSFNDLSETSLTFDPEVTAYGFVYAEIKAYTTAGTGWYRKSENIHLGTPLTLPFKESFPNYWLDHPWGDGLTNGPQVGSISDDSVSSYLNQYNGWNRMTDSSFDSSEGSQDHDNGFAGMFGWSYTDSNEPGGWHNEYNELVSPSIMLTGAENPVLTFYTYNWTDRGISDPNTLDVDVVTADGQRHRVSHFVIGELGDEQGWMYVMADLSEFARQEIYLIFTGTIISGGDVGYNWVLLDNIRIGSLSDVDLAVSHIKAPVIATPGDEFEVSARVTNLGKTDVASFRATLLCNGEEVETKTFGALASTKFVNVEFNHSLTVTSPIGNVYAIRVDAAGDAMADNNLSSEVTVARNLQLLPEPEKVYLTETGDRLYWSEPDFEAAVPELITDDFESYPCIEYTYDEEDETTYGWVTFLTEAGEWVFVDRDEYPIGGMMKWGESGYEYIQFPGIPVHSAQSWWVQNRLFMDFNDTYYGHDNSLQYLANMYVVNEAHDKAMPEDDWAITPELCGRQQLVTFWARSYDPNIPETVEFLYSTGSVNPDDFKLISRIELLSGDWTQYAIVVPEGGRRFAIRGCSYVDLGSSQIFIDDVSFYPAKGERQQLDFIGYNIYKGNMLLNAAPLSGLEYPELTGGTDYAVSAVYKQGESRAVQAVDLAGFGSLTAENVKVNASEGLITITGLEGAAYSVVSSTGVVYGSGKGVDSARISVPQGVYIVRLPNRSIKAVVR